MVKKVTGKKRKYGKWVGGALGWAFGGPIGAALGFFMGMMFDDNSMAEDRTRVEGGNAERYRHRTRSGDFAASLIVLSGAVMKADERVLKSELNYVRDFFVKNFGEETAEHHLILLRDILKKEIPVREVCGQIRYFMEHPNRILLLQYLFGIAQADGAIDPREVQVIRTISHYLGISAKDFESIHAMFAGGGARTTRTRPIAEAYKILEVEESAADADVKHAYRRMATKYHPDKNRNVGEEYQQMAQDKFIKVQEAYDQIKKKRGMK